MFLVIALVIAFVYGMLQPFATRLLDKSLWVGKALVPDEFKSAYPTGLQNALTTGWPSTYIFCVGMLPILSAAFGFFYTWWAAIICFFASIILNLIFSSTKIAPTKVERYIAILGSHANNRVANFKKNRDVVRAEAAEDLSEKIAEILIIYIRTDVPVPTIKQAKSAPYGDKYYLLDSRT